MQEQHSIPKVAIIPVTYRCNAKCTMCNIWCRHEENETALEDLLALFKEPLVADNLQSVNLTGGEPTLREDLVAIAEGILSNCTKLDSITLNSNGLIPERLGNAVEELCRLQKEIRDYSLLCYLSVDGLGDMHDKVRGVPGSFEKVMESIDLLGKLSRSSKFSFSINFTINRLNYLEMDKVYAFIVGKGLKIDFTYSMKSSIYFSNDDTERYKANEESARDYICAFLRGMLGSSNFTFSPSYYRNLIKILHGETRKVGCIFTNEGFFLDPSGDVYRCWAFDMKLGNIREQNFSQIWHGEKAIESGAQIKEQCQNCYNNCYSQYKRIDSIRNILVTSGENV